MLSPPATAAPTTAIPSRPATRATALLTPLAIPASLSPASASTVAVSGATIIESPTEKTSSGGSSSRPVVEARLEPRRARASAAARDERPDAHEEARPEAHRQPSDARREQEHDDRDRDEREAALQRRVAGELLQEEHEEERQRREPGVDGRASRGSRRRSCGARRGRSGSIGCGARRSHQRNAAKSDDAADERDEDQRVAPAAARLLDQREDRARRARARRARRRRRRRAARAFAGGALRHARTRRAPP